MKKSASLVHFALVLASGLIGVATTEAGLRLIDGVAVFDRRNFISEALDIARVNSTQLDFDDQLGWTLMAGLKGPGLTTTRFGIRNNGVGRSLLPSGAVLAVGNSFTAGSQVTDGDTWPAQLERLIRRPVLNAGVGAYGVDQMVLRAESLARELRPSTVIVGILSQDSLRNAYDVYGGGMKPWFNLADGRLELRNVPVRRFAQTGRGLGTFRSIFGYSYAVDRAMIHLGLQHYWIDGASAYHRVMENRAAVDVSCALLKRLKEVGRQQDFDVIVLMLWGAQEAADKNAPWYGVELVACARAMELKTLDLHPDLHRISVENPAQFAALWVNEGGALGHPSAMGHEITARRLREQFFAP